MILKKIINSIHFQDKTFFFDQNTLIVAEDMSKTK